jgi:hypothetical protein
MARLPGDGGMEINCKCGKPSDWKVQNVESGRYTWSCDEHLAEALSAASPVFVLARTKAIVAAEQHPMRDWGAGNAGGRELD